MRAILSLFVLLFCDEDLKSFDMRSEQQYTFRNNTYEFLDVEISLLGLLKSQNRFAEKIAPGESIAIKTSGCMDKGFNIWRTYRPRNYTGLLGAWKINHDDNTCTGEFILSINKEAWQGFSPSGDLRSEAVQNQVWSKLNADNQKIIKSGGYNFESYNLAQGVTGQFYQGSDAAWTNAVPSKIKEK